MARPSFHVPVILHASETEEQNQFLKFIVSVETAMQTSLARYDAKDFTP